MKLKKGVRIHGICDEISFVMTAIEGVYLEHGAEAVVTSAIDGTHSRKSKHYSGQAIDLRTRNVDTEHHRPLTAALQAAVGEDFDVVLERDHIHLEWDPKGPYNKE